MKTKIFDQDIDIGQCHLDKAKTYIHAKETNIDAISDSFSLGWIKGYSWCQPLTIQNVEFLFDLDNYVKLTAGRIINLWTMLSLKGPSILRQIPKNLGQNSNMD